MLRLMIPQICKKAERASFDQGMGRHTKAEVYEMGLKDLRALSTLLGGKTFFAGDTPTEIDCAMFGMLAQIIWNVPVSDPFHQICNGNE